MRLLLVILLLILWHGGGADELSADEMRAAALSNVVPATKLFRKFLSFPNDANNRDSLEHLITWMEITFDRHGFETWRLPTQSLPVLIAERPVPGAEKTVLIYLQADGQPVDPSAWDQPNPYGPVLKAPDGKGGWIQLDWERLTEDYDPDWRIFARSASDSKGPMTQFLMAMTLLDELGQSPMYNLKVLIDTEEELGSPNLAQALIEQRDRLAADMLLVFDGPPHASNRPTVSFGARGSVALTLTAYGPKVAQHSGHYGNFVPNPALALSQILGSMKTPDGVVLIDGFYDGVSISDEVRAELERVPDDEQAILASMGLLQADQVAPSLQESLQYPSLNIRGLSAAWVGNEARTVIPPTATAEIDIRLVMESDPERLVGLVRSHIESLGFTVLDGPPNDQERQTHARIVSLSYDFSYGAFRTPFDAPPGLMARAGLLHLYGKEPVLIRTMGGSIPIAPIIDALGLPAATVPTVNIDNNQHSPNENIRLGNFVEGIAMLMAVLGQDAP